MRSDTPEYIVGIAKKLRKNSTTAEAVLWEKLRNSQVCGLRFRRQYGIGRYIVDFYCSKANLVIEVDGDIHKEKNQMEYDYVRQKELEVKGLTVLRFSNDEVLYDMNTVINRISAIIKNIK